MGGTLGSCVNLNLCQYIESRRQTFRGIAYHYQGIQLNKNLYDSSILDVYLFASDVKGCAYLKESISIFDSTASQCLAVEGHSGKEIFPSLVKELKQMSQVANDCYKEYVLPND